MASTDAAPIAFLANTSWYLYNFRAGLLRAVRDAGHEVICLSPLDTYSPLLESELGGRHVVLGVAGANRGPVTEAATLASVWRQLRRVRPACLCNFTVKANIYGGLAARALGIPYINNVSGLGTIFLHDRWLYRRVQAAYVGVNRRADHVFFQNPQDREAFRRAGLAVDAAVTILPGSGVDLDRFAWAPMPAGPLRFVLIARLLGDKGVREYAEAARRIRAESHEVVFDLVGPLGAANDTALSADEVQAWAAEGVIRYHGEAADVRPFLEAAHVFVLPSYREGMPRTVLEAAAVGRPSLVTDVPGCRHAVVPEHTGWLCQPRDAGSLAEVMRRVYELPREALAGMSGRARAHAEEHFSEEIIIRAYLDRIAQCLGAA